MRLRKQVISAGLCTVLIFQAAMPVFAKENGAKYTKKESVYAKLHADGASDDAYVINHFSVKNAGEIKDYGAYKNVKNLTTLDDLKTQNKQTKFKAKKGEFYYQGTIQDVKLPWKYKITYELNNEVVTADELGGRSGKLKIHLSVKENKGKTNEFFEHYVTQISLTLSNEKAKNIKAKGATIADAGDDSQISLTVLPGKEADFTIQADVTNFSMSGFSIAAVPYSMDIDLGDYGIDDMTGQFDELIEATNELNTGMKKLGIGMQQLGTNSSTLLKGMNDLNKGVGTLNKNSSTLINGSAQIKKGLSTMSTSLSQADFSQMSQLKTLPASIKQMSSGLKKLKNGLLQLQKGFDQSYNALDQAMQQAQTTTLSKEELALVKEEAGSDTELGSAVRKLLTSYENMQKLTGTWKSVKPAFTAVSTSLNAENEESLINGLDSVINGLDQMSESLGSSLEGVDIEKQMKSLEKGLNQLSTSYAAFHKGLKSYTKGVASVYEGSSQYQMGLSKYLKGVTDAGQGLSTLENGMQQYSDGVAKIPDQMQKTIDEMMEEYQSSDDQPCSFTDSRNKNIGSVQFVISTQEIKEPEVKKKEKKESKTGFIDRLKTLF